MRFYADGPSIPTPSEADGGLTAPKGALVKAVLHTHYGSPDLLELREVDKPIPKANQVLIAMPRRADWDTDAPLAPYGWFFKAPAAL
jgi:hypothetical protein